MKPKVNGEKALVMTTADTSAGASATAGTSTAGAPPTAGASTADTARAGTNASAEATQLQRITRAVESAVAVGPRFLSGAVDADAMAHTMLGAVRDYVAAERADGRSGAPLSERATELYPVLQELVACGGGFLAGRCDAACVGRTMTALVREHAA